MDEGTALSTSKAFTSMDEGLTSSTNESCQQGKNLMYCKHDKKLAAYEQDDQTNIL